MKNRKWMLLVLLFSSSGCSDFYHLHYRKLDKIPAHGDYLPTTFSPEKKSIPSEKKEGLTFCESNDSLNDKTNVVFHVEHKKSFGQRIFQPIKIQEEKMISEKNRARIKTAASKIKHVIHSKGKEAKDHHVLIIIGLLLLGFFLLSYGVGLIIVGIMNVVVWVIFAGIAVLALGLLPFLGMISMVVGDRHEPSEKQFEEKRE
jgi:hypothetical protein